MDHKAIFYNGFLQSPIGLLELSASKIGLCSVTVVQKEGIEKDNEHISFHKKQLQDYFEKKTPLAAESLDLSGYSDFEKQVWRALTEIPFGKTISYKDLSLAINNPKAIRAVGTANGRNPILIIIPCHRVIGSDGSLTGYSAGIEKKRQLLIHENAIAQELF